MADVIERVKGKVVYAEDILDLFYVASAGQDKAFVEVVEDVIENAPTADVEEVRHGQWESFEIPHMMRCSECGVSDLDIHRTKFAFCPYCGAIMDGGEAE